MNELIKQLKAIDKSLGFICIFLFLITLNTCGSGVSNPVKVVILTPTPVPTCTGVWYKDCVDCIKKGG